MAKLSKIVEKTDNAIILTDKNGNFVWINEAFTKIFGYTLKELTKDVSPNIIADKTEDSVKDVINKCINEKVTVEYELKIKTKKEKEIWVHTTLTPMLDENGEISSLIAIDTDITKQKKYERQILEQKDQITGSIRYALKIQESMLPEKEEISSFFENFIIYHPKDIVSGDFYWISNIFEIKNNKLELIENSNNGFNIGQTFYIVVADCTGHGVPGAFMSLIGTMLLEKIINEIKICNPKDILYELDYRLNKVLRRNNNRNYDGMVISICKIDKYADNNQEKFKITFSGSKQNIHYYKNDTNEFVKIRGSARQIGFSINNKLDFYNKEFELSKGDYLFLYSDGLKDLNNPKRETFGQKRIIKILQENINKPMLEMGNILEIEMNKWLNRDIQRDDVTFIGLKI